MRVFVTLLVPAVSLLNLGVQAATISNGLISRASDDLVMRRQFHNADFNSGSSSPESHGRIDSSSNPVSPRQIPNPSDVLDTLGTGIPADAVAALAGSAPAGDVANSLTGAASRRQLPEVTGIPANVSSQASTLASSTPVGGVADSLSDSIGSRRQLPDAIAPSEDVGLPSFEGVEVPNLAGLTSGISATRDLKDMTEEDIAATDDDVDKDLKDMPHTFDVLSDAPDLSKDRESAEKERRQANVTALQSSVLEQELVKSLTNATKQA